jgi:IMP dehydrogenase/GMP reductase
MAIINETHYTYRDLTILPGRNSLIEHRAECNPFNQDGMLPLFTAPMDTVVGTGNFHKFYENGIIPILPRTESLEIRAKYAFDGYWSAFSLKEFEDIFCDEENKKIFEGHTIKALIDVANGHMKKITKLVWTAKQIYGDRLEVMAGNIANPDTYVDYAIAGVDYIRCGVGAGFGCLSTSNTGVHMPMASLIDKVSEVKKKVKRWLAESPGSYKSIPKIVADGGIRNYSDVIKALALGADYVMVGSIFASMLESAAPKMCNSEYDKPLIDYDNMYMRDNVWYLRSGGEKEHFLGDISAVFYGMASREGQIAMNGSKTKTSEGIKKIIPVKYTMAGWTENFKDYLRSAMSYVGASTLEEFGELAVLIVNSENAISVVNK